MTDTGGFDCTRLEDSCAELALGVLPACERAEAMAHLQSCPACRQHLRELALTADALVGLVADSEPPIGFEGRVLERLGLSSKRPLWRRVVARYRFALPAAAAAAALAFGGVGGWVIGASQSPSPPAVTAPGANAEHSLLSAKLVAYRHTIGLALISTGSSPWLYMSLDADDGVPAVHAVKCELQRGDGSTITFGPYQLTNGYGHWDGPYPAGSSPITGIRLLAGNGSLLATATFRPMYPLPQSDQT